MPAPYTGHQGWIFTHTMQIFITWVNWICQDNLNMNKDVILEGEKMKQVGLSTLGAPLKLLYVQFIAEITQMFAWDQFPCRSIRPCIAVSQALLPRGAEKEKQLL